MAEMKMDTKVEHTITLVISDDELESFAKQLENAVDRGGTSIGKELLEFARTIIHLAEQDW